MRGDSALSRPWRHSTRFVLYCVCVRARAPPQLRGTRPRAHICMPRAIAPPTPGLPPGVAPQCRRVRAEAPLSEHALRQCSDELHWNPSGGPIVATFATSISHPWLLGLSAAKQGLPIVVAGLGRNFPSHFSWWLGYAKKFPGSVRAAQVIHQLAPHAPVLWVDSTDTVLVNPVVGSAARAVDELHSAGIRKHSAASTGLTQRSRVLVGAECYSWPRCYEADYARDPEHLRCLKSSHSCYPNAGTYLSTSAGMLELQRAHNSTWQSFLGTPMSNAECTHDQAVLQHIVMNRSRDQYSHLDLQLDSSSSVFLNMHECRPPKRFSLRNLSMCYHREHRPLDHAQIEHHGNRSSLWYKPGLQVPQGLPTLRKMRHDWTRPLIAHAAGDHKVLTDGPFFERLRSELSEDKALLDYPVLLVDHGGVVCTTSTIGEVYRVQTGNRPRALPASRPAATQGTAMRVGPHVPRAVRRVH